MKRENLNNQLETIKTKINELSKKKFRYFINNKYIAGFGPLQLIETKTELVKAFSFVKSQFQTENFESIEAELGLQQTVEVEEQTYLGYDFSEWTEEFKMKASELQNESNIENLKKALKTFKGYRTEDEQFESDAKKFSDLFLDLGITESEENSPHNTVIITE